MEGERILKSLLNGETDGLYEDTKSYLSPLQFPLKTKNGLKGNKTTEETISKYTSFCAKFLRCAVETLKKVKGKGNNIDEITNSLKLVSSLLYNTLAAHNGKYLKVIQSLDQLGKTIYLIVVQLIGKEQFDYALSHARDLLSFLQLVKTWKNYDIEKMEKEFASLSLRASDALLQGAGKLEEIKVTVAQRPLHLCCILDWRKVSLLFQAEALFHSSLKSLVEKTLKCGTKYQVDCGQKNVNFEHLASFFESIFNVVISKTECLIHGGKDSLYLLVELGFHYGRICGKAGMSAQTLTVFDKVLEISQSIGHCKNGHAKAQFPSQVCCCVCLLCKAAISLNCTNTKSQIENSTEQSLVECNRLLNQILKCKTLSSVPLKLISDALEYFRISLQSAHNKGADNQKKRKAPMPSRRTFSETTSLLQSYVTILSLQCERLKDDISKLNYDSSTHFRQQLKKIKDRQLGVLSFIISSFQDQLKLNDESVENFNSELRCYIEDCHPVVEKASDLIHSALDDPDVTLSENELRWLGCNVYNLGCVCYQRDCFLEGAPLLTIACKELKVWCFASRTEEEMLERIKEVKLLTKFSLLIDCQRRARQLSDALRTATVQVLISVKSGSDVCILRQHIKQWTTVKHEQLKTLQGQEKQVERSRTLCAALANLEDTEDVVSDQLCLVLQEELVCYKEKSYDTAVEQIAVIKQLMELYIVEEEEFEYGSSMLELAVALSYHGELAEDINKSAHDFCHEAVTILEHVSDKMAFANKDEFYLSLVKDRLAVAYLWQALLEHRFAMEEKQLEETVEISESFDANELDGIYLEQSFVSSLLSSLETWVELIERSIPKDKEKKINLQHFYNAEESFHYLLVTACLLGLVNQPVKKVYALHLASLLSQAIGSTSVLENGVTALCEAVHTMCEVLSVHHARSLIHFASKMLDDLESSDLVRVRFLLAKSHFLLLSGKYSEGEDCLREVQESKVLMLKSYESHLLKARFLSLCSLYSVLPAKHHIFTLIVDPVLGSLTPLECAVDGFHKLSRIAEEVFGEDIFNTGNKKENKKEIEQGARPMLPSSSTQNVFHLSLLDNLLSSLLHVGQLYSHQGAVREAFRQFIDGLALARHFCLPYRISDFLVNIAQLELKQGKSEKCQRRLEQLKGILQAALRTSSDVELVNESVEEPLFIGHPESCQCTSCNDPVLHAIIIKYYTCFSQYMTCVSGPEQLMTVLDLADSVCSCAQSKMFRYLDGLDKYLHLCYQGNPESGEKKLDEKQKKGKSKCAKSKNRKEDDRLLKTSSFCLMFCQHQLMLQCMKAEHWLCNGQVENASSELSKGMETLACIENTIGITPVCFIPIKASFLYFSGVTVLLLNKRDFRNIFTGCNRSAKYPPMHLSIEDNITKGNSLKADPLEEEIEKPRRGVSQRGRNSRAAEETCCDKKSRATSSRARGRGRRKERGESVIECDNSTESNLLKPKGKKRGTKSTTEVEDVCVDKTAPMWFNQVTGYWKEAFDLCIAFPRSSLFPDICKGLAFCLARTAPGRAMHYLNWSMSVTLRHQALTSSGKRIKRITKDAGVVPLVQELGKEITHLTDELSSLSLNGKIAPEVTYKLDALVKVRSMMKFKSFSLEEEALLQKIPRDWTLCTLESFEPPGVEERELIICRMKAGCEPVLVKINTTTGEDKLKENESADIVMDLTELFQCNLMEEFGNIMNNSVKSMSIESTSEWWAKRNRLDSKMKNFLEKLEAAWLGKWKGVLLGQPVDKDCQDSVIAMARELQTRIVCLYGFEPDMQLLEVLVSSLPYLSQQEMREALAEITGIDPVSPNLNQLLDEFGDFSSSMLSRDKQRNDMKRLRNKLDTVSRHPVILILGKDIQQLPWESLPILYDQPVTRVPSLQFLLAKISCESQLSEVNPERTFYALNPQNNLPNTQKMFQKWFESENGWVGITGQAPSQKEFKKALTDYDLFIYFGHGTGREFLQGDDIQRLDCGAATLLMGCSSGKLMVEGKCEPRGMVLNYLLAGCPAIVANLWDVTDKDIDRFSDSLLKQWLDSDTQLSLPEVLCRSRHACKLKYLIGASPVLYGLPLHVKR